MNTRSRNTQQALLSSTETGLCESTRVHGVPHSMRLSRGLWWRGHHPEREEGIGTPGEKGNKTGGYTSRWCALAAWQGVSESENFEGQRLGAFPTKSSFSILTVELWFSFPEYTKQAGSKWLNAHLFGAVFKTMGCVQIWFWRRWAFELKGLSL